MVIPDTVYMTNKSWKKPCVQEIHNDPPHAAHYLCFERRVWCIDWTSTYLQPIAMPIQLAMIQPGDRLVLVLLSLLCKARANVSILPVSSCQLLSATSSCPTNTAFSTNHTAFRQPLLTHTFRRICFCGLEWRDHVRLASGLSAAPTHRPSSTVCDCHLWGTSATQPPDFASTRSIASFCSANLSTVPKNRVFSSLEGAGANEKTSGAYRMYLVGPLPDRHST